MEVPVYIVLSIDPKEPSAHSLAYYSFEDEPREVSHVVFMEPAGWIEVPEGSRLVRDASDDLRLRLPDGRLLATAEALERFGCPGIGGLDEVLARFREWVSRRRTPQLRSVV